MRGKKAAASCGETAEVLVFEAVLAEEFKHSGAEAGKLLPVFFIDCNGLPVGERYTLSVGEVRADKAAGGIKADTPFRGRISYNADAPLRGGGICLRDITGN